MTNNRGYIYVLANSAMPDLVKVGKTTRTPVERAAELSKVTGVPTPFIVVYEQLVDDCTAAEEFVHNLLTQKGFREANNREFFRVPVSEVVKIVSTMPSGTTKVNQSYNGKLNRSLWREAENALIVGNVKKAVEFYKQSAELGCFSAYRMLGDLYKWQDDKEETMTYYSMGARAGDYYCYLEMAEISRSSNYKDFHGFYKLFFENRKNPNVNKLVEAYAPTYSTYSQYLNQHVFKWVFLPFSR